MTHETIEISLHNYDDRYRAWGIATLPWNKVSNAPAGRARIKGIKRIDEPGGKIYAQIDVIDPDDSSLAELTIFVDDYIKGGGVKVGMESWRVQLDIEIDDTPLTPAQIASNEKARAASVSNTQNFYVHNEGAGHIGGYVYLPDGPKRWQGGAITSIALDGKEILDAPKAERGVEGHDSEKRLQLDRVSLANPPWSRWAAVEHSLYREPWTFVAAGGGFVSGRNDVRMWVNIRSSVFDHEYVDERGNTTIFHCHLYRVISAFRHANQLVEDLYVKGAPENGKTAVRLHFAPHYFLKMQFADAPLITHVPGIPDWFSIGTYREPNPGFGFAATVPVTRIDSPPEDYPNEDQYKAAFGWQLGYAYSVRTFSLFRRWVSPSEMANDTGRLWFELIYKPLQGRVV